MSPQVYGSPPLQVALIIYPFKFLSDREAVRARIKKELDWKVGGVGVKLKPVR